MSVGNALNPNGLLHWLAHCSERKETCIECGAGQGEISAYVSQYFTTVLATDISPLTERSHYGVTVNQSSAEQLPSADSDIDMVISMQALHFFDVPRHLAEAKRVLRPGGVFAALSWGELELPPDVAYAYQPTFESLLSHWEAEREWVISGYEGLNFSGTRLELPKSRMVREVALSDLDNEIANWSATQRALELDADIEDPDLHKLTVSASKRFSIGWPLHGQVFRV